MQYVVLEFNQASGMPRTATDDVFFDADDARREARDLLAQTVEVGRRERFAVAALDIVWRSDDYC